MEKRKIHRKAVILGIIFSLALIPNLAFAQDDPNAAAYQRAVVLSRRLSPEEKVGQLFMVTMDGDNISESSEIYQLITNYYIGGVVLKDENQNFQGEATTNQIHNLISGLQNIEWLVRNERRETDTDVIQNDYVPLFIGVSQPGGSYPHDSIFNGLTSLPSQMAIGATWDPAKAFSIGEIKGRELETLGFNLILGPSLDVLDITYSGDNLNLGVQSFGGDPFWVGEMSAEYISGLHSGSKQRLAVIARNFPGGGSTDRFPGEEVATVRKSLDQLELIDLAPFFRVVEAQSGEDTHVADGLLTSHVRYQGFQGNIRATTKPISFDQTAIETIMQLEPLNTWQEGGGILVTQDLGSPSVDRFFNPDGQFIDARQIARNAFLAGNDLLYIDKLQSTGDATRFETYRKTMDLFVQKYKEDPAFAVRVDASVVKILTLKFKMYENFDLDTVIPNPVNLQNIGLSSAQVFEVANSAATLVNPSQNQVDEALPAPPAFGDRMVIFTDEQTAQQCNTCTPIDIFPANGLEKSIEKLYGPAGNGQINPNQIISYSYKDLAEYIENPFNRTDLEANLSKADWVIFALRELDPTAQTSYALHDLIAKDAVILQDKNNIVFSFDVPFIFDATEIASFSAYYAMYGKNPPFLDVAARVIFQEMNPSGASPVSIPGIAYDLIATLQPDSEQIIALEVDQEAARELIVEDEISVLENGVDSDLPNFELGDLLPVKTGVIVDHNGHPVPDGTIVRFVMNEQGTISNTQQAEAETIDGVARASFILQKVGVHEINVTSEPAMLSQILVLDITGEEAIVSAIIPTPMPTADPDGTESDTQDGQSDEISANPNSKFSEWILSVVVAWLAGLSAFYLLVNLATTQERVKVAAGSVVSGLLVSLWFAFGLAQDGPVRSGMNGYLRVMLIVLVWALLGGIMSWLFFTRIYPGLSQE